MKGTVTALITPFSKGKLDEKGLAQNIDYQVAQGIDGVFALGTTGEAPTISSEERIRVISVAVECAKGKIPVWVGTGSYCTQEAIKRTKQAKDLGADVALIVVPYYNKPTQEGIYRHFEAIATAVEIPIILYNIPGRCQVNVELDTLMRIAALPNIAGVKEAGGSINQAGDIINKIVKKYPHFFVFSGDDVLTYPMMALGAVGVVSVVSNLLPSQVIAQVNAALEGKWDKAREMHYELLPLYKAAFIETNPIPIKTAMDLCGLPAGECRLPLCQMAPENLNYLRQVLLQMGIKK